MPAARRLTSLLAAFLAVVVLAVPATAGAQSTSVPQLEPTVSTPMPTTTPSAPSPSPAPSPDGSQLPNTGVDARLLAAVGLALLLCGIGLRMRSTDERF